MCQLNAIIQVSFRSLKIRYNTHVQNILKSGILGSILVKEGRMPSVSDVVSGAIKVALKPIKQNDSTSQTNKPRNEALMAQVNSLKQELQLLSSSRAMTIVTSSGTGGRRYGVIIVIVAVGYGYVWWKGWKIPDFMFATRRGLSDACKSVAKNLDDVFHSLRATRNELSSKLDDSIHKYDEIAASSSNTKDEITRVRKVVSRFPMDVQTVNETIRTLETKMGKIQEKQDKTKEAVGKLLLCTLDEENKLGDLIQDSPSSVSRPAIEPQPVASSSRTVSLPVTLEPSSPSTSYESNEVNGHTSNGFSALGLKEYEGRTGGVGSSQSPKVSNGDHVTEKSPSPELPATPTNVRSAGLLSRTISATRYFKFM